jgi:hypothetical protein
LKSEVKEHKNEGLYTKLPDERIGKLNKYLYGLKQAGSEWFNNLSSTMPKHGYKISRSDQCRFTKRKKNRDRLITSVHIDDLYVISSKNNMIDELCEILKLEYGEITTKSGEKVAYLRMDVIKTKDGIKFSIEGYIDKILKDKHGRLQTSHDSWWQ